MRVATYVPLLISIGVLGLTLACFDKSVAADDDANDQLVLLQDSFEEGNRAPDGWKQGAAVPGVRYAWDSKEASDGSKSLSLRKRAKRYFPVAEWSRAARHRDDFASLQVSVQVKAAGATKATVDVVFLDDRNKWIKHEWAAYIGAKQAGDRPADHDWKEYKGSVQIPAGTKSIQISLQIYGPGNVWFDELVARYQTEAPAGQKTARSSKTAATRTRATRKAKQSAPADKPVEGSVSVDVTDNAVGRYLLTPVPESMPEGGYGLVIALPGGAGNADFHPFVRRIQEHALNDEFLVAQPLAVKWTPQQKIVWPTSRSRVAKMQFTTEQLVASVIDDVASKQTVDSDRVFLLAWSSSGPAAYATLLQKTTPLNGALIAMSVFKPRRLPPVENARDRSFYLLHSREDKVCPFRMAADAQQSLSSAGANVQLATYMGGHGWHGDVFGMIRKGVDWLEETGQ